MRHERFRVRIRRHGLLTVGGEAAVDEQIDPDDTWDAGGMGCGELVFLLMIRLRAMHPGHVLKLTATDPGAPHDIPAWCRMTGNRLVRAEPPQYFIQRKES